MSRFSFLLAAGIVLVLGACAYSKAIEHQKRMTPVIEKADRSIRLGQTPQELKNGGFELHNCSGPIEKPVYCQASFDTLNSSEVPSMIGTATMSADNKTEGRSLVYDFYFTDGRLSSFKSSAQRIR
jgi:hypothetical protein